MNHSIRALMFVMLALFVVVGCSDGNGNVTENASQEELDNYNKLIEQAEKEMQGDGEVEDLKE
ncbi:MAG: hypothetical protein WBD20_07525 [Pirellulaceae bacterium]